MSNDYFKAQGWFKNYALNSQDSRGVFQQLVKEDEEAFRLASAETDKIKEEMNKQFGSGTIKYGSEIPKPEIKTPQAIFEFSQRNPAAEGGRMGFKKGLDVEQIIVPNKTFNKKKIGFYNSRNKDTKEYTGKPFVRDSTKNKPLPPNAVRSGESVIFTGPNAQADAEKFLELTKPKGGDLTELKRLIDESNKGFKFVKIKDLQETAGFSRQTSFGSSSGIYGSLDTLETKLQKAFDYVMGDPNKLVVDMFDPMSQVKKLVGTNDAPGRYLKGYEPYESSKKIIGVLAKPKSKTKLRKAEGLTFGDLQFRIDNNVKGDVLFAPPKQVSAETKIFDIADRHIKQGGTKIEWTVKPEITPGGNPSYGEARFKYNGKEYGMGELINNAKDDPNFKEFFKAQREYKTINDKMVEHPKTGKKIRFGNLMKEVYGDSVVPYNVDHYKSILDEPFTSLRVLPRRINTAAGNIISFNEMDITKPELAGKYSDAGKEMQLKKIGYNYNQSIDDLIEAELKLAKDVLVDGRVLRKPNEIIESIRKGENYKPDFYSKDAKPGPGFDKVIPDIDYIDGKKDFVGVNSGFNTDLLMKDPLVQKILNSKSGQAIAKSLRGAAGTVGKVFGGADVVLGILDYQNNISKGQKHNEALGNAVQAMSFGLYKSGDRARVKEVKDIFVKNGGDGEIFDQATALNAKDQEINDLIFDSKKKADTFVRYAKEGRGVLTPDLEKSKSDYNVLKKNLNEEIKNKIQERDNMVESYKTNLRVSEAGAPIQIGGNEFFSQPFKDVKQSTMDKIAEDNRKAYDMQKRQVNFTSGKYGNFLQNNIFTMNPQEKAALQKQINNMDERELYKFNLSRGMDPDNLIRFEDLLNIKSSNPDLMGVNTTKYVNYDDRKAEGGITELRSKYEYKK